MRVYLDTCAIQRPLNDQGELRIRVEAEAVLAVIAAAEAGEVELVASDVLRFETENTPHPHRRGFARRTLRLAVGDVASTPEVLGRAQQYQREGIKPLDAVHLASAVEASGPALLHGRRRTPPKGPAREHRGHARRIPPRTHRRAFAMNAPARPLAEVTERALHALTREIGVADTARFLQQFGAGYGDYTKERDALFGHLSVEEIVEQSRRYPRG